MNWEFRFNFEENVALFAGDSIEFSFGGAINKKAISAKVDIEYTDIGPILRRLVFDGEELWNYRDTRNYHEEFQILQNQGWVSLDNPEDERYHVHMVSTTKFDLKEEIRRLATVQPDPAAIASTLRMAMQTMPESDVRDIADEAIGPYITMMMATARNNVIRQGVSDNSSPRWSAASAAYRRILGAAEKVGGGWKFLGDCTYDDLMVVASIRREHAAATLRRAEQYEELARIMRKKNAKVVSDLDPDILMDVFNDTP